MATIFDQTKFDASRINKSFEENHLKIEESYLKLYDSLHRVPTIREIAEHAGFNPMTVSNHLKAMRISDITPKQKIRMQRILNALAIKAESGDVKAIELYFNIVGNWIKKSEIISDENGKTVKVIFADSKEDIKKITEAVKQTEGENEYTE